MDAESASLKEYLYTPLVTSLQSLDVWKHVLWNTL